MRKRPINWTEDLDEYLFKTRFRGDSFRSIAAALGVSVNAAIGRFRRLCELRGLNPHLKHYTRKQAA